MGDKKISFTLAARLANLSVAACCAGLIWLILKVFGVETSTLLLIMAMGIVVSGQALSFLKVWIMPGLVLGAKVLKIRQPLGSPTVRIPYFKIISVEVKNVSGKPRIIIKNVPVRAGVGRGERSQFTIVPEWYTISIDEFIREIHSKMESVRR